MRQLSAVLLISTVVFIAVFGVFFMRHVEGEAHIGPDCPISAIEGSSCDKVTTPMASVAFHMKTLLQPAVIPALAGILMLSAIFALALALLSDISASSAQVLFAYAFASAVPVRLVASRKIRAWLVMHEKRDPSSLIAMSA